MENHGLKNEPENGKVPGEPFWIGPGYRGEYQCPHGVGHGNHIHGCDGCCSLPDFPLNKNNIEATCEKESKARAKRRK